MPGLCFPLRGREPLGGRCEDHVMGNQRFVAKGLAVQKPEEGLGRV